MLAVDAITVPYGLAPGFSLHVAAGERVAVLGANGAGKTTLVRTLTGALTPSAGQVRIAGEPLSHWSPRALARRLSWVPQQTHLDFQFTVREMVTMGRHPWRARWSGLSDTDRSAVDAALERTALSPLAARPVRTLSGGEQQRVVLARAFAQSPEALLLDEPTAHLDLAHRAAMLEWVTDTELTVLAVLHDLNLAALYFPRLVLMAAGRIIVDGAPDTVLTVEHLRVAFGVEPTIVRHPDHDIPQVLLGRGHP